LGAELREFRISSKIKNYANNFARRQSCLWYNPVYHKWCTQSSIALPRQKPEQGVFLSLVPGFPPAHSVPVESEPEKKGVSLLFPRNTHGCINPKLLSFL